MHSLIIRFSFGKFTINNNHFTMTIQLTDAEKIKILNGDDLFGVMQKILLREEKIDQNREHFWVVGLETNCRILFIELVSLGTVNRTYAEPMEVFSLALQKRAVRIIIVHNHPSGDLKPSEEDIDVTDRLFQVGRIVNTPVEDHLIISLKSYLSFKQIGLLDKISKSTKYVPEYELAHKYRLEGEELGKKDRSIEIAKKMKLDSINLETISKFTGLTIEEIKKIRVRRKK